MQAHPDQPWKPSRALPWTGALLQRLDARGAAVLVTAVGLALRVAVLVWFAREPLVDDAVDYEAMARALAGGVRFNPDWPPGLPYYLALAHALFGASALVARAAMVPLYLGLAACVYHTTHRLAGRRSAVLALLAVALTPSQILFSVTPLTQLPATLLLVASVTLADDAATRPSTRALLLLGGCLGMLVLVRPSSLLLAAGLPLVVAWRSRRLRAALVPFVVAAALVFAWMSKVHTMTGRWVLVNDANAQNLFYGNNPATPLYRTWWLGSHKAGEEGVSDDYLQAYGQILQQPPSGRGRLFVRGALGHILARPDLFVLRSLSRVRTFAAFDSFTGTTLAKRNGRLAGAAALATDAAAYLASVGLAIAFACTRQAHAARYRSTLLVTTAALLLYSLPYFISFSHPTYHFPVVPLLLPFAADYAVRPRALTARLAFGAVVVALGCIQIEWVTAMAARF